MSSPSSVITLGLTHTPSLLLTLGYGDFSVGAAALTRLVVSRTRLGPSLVVSRVEKWPRASRKRKR
jgi:hypothetical protein